MNILPNTIKYAASKLACFTTVSKKLLQHSVKNTIVAYPISFVLYHSIATNLYSYKDFPKCFSFHYNQTEYYESEPHIVNLKTCRQGDGMN